MTCIKNFLKNEKFSFRLGIHRRHLTKESNFRNDECLNLIPRSRANNGAFSISFYFLVYYLN